jgi:hypothetical protein
LIVIAAAVELLRVLQQGEAEFDQASTVGQVVVGGCQSFGEVAALTLDVSEFLLDLGLGEGAVGRQVDQVLFLRVEAT